MVSSATIATTWPPRMILLTSTAGRQLTDPSLSTKTPTGVLVTPNPPPLPCLSVPSWPSPPPTPPRIFAAGTMITPSCWMGSPIVARTLTTSRTRSITSVAFMCRPSVLPASLAPPAWQKGPEVLRRGSKIRTSPASYRCRDGCRSARSDRADGYRRPRGSRPGAGTAGQQGPRSCQTWATPGVSPCVHHFARQPWLWYETSCPPVYAVPEQVPRSSHTSALPGVSPCVHHLARHVWPW